MGTKKLCETCKDITCLDYETRRDKECLDYEPMTNADRIRAMTDEELAELLAPVLCPYLDCPSELPFEDTTTCKDCWLDWLRQEVDNDA